MTHLNAGNAADACEDQDKYDQLESKCTFLGFVAIKDPPRDEVKGAIEDCKTAGISVIMITGDAKETAIAIAKEIGILTPT
jgi:Ca2+-transporting ATPase